MSLSKIEKNIIDCVFTKSNDSIIGKPLSNVELLTILEDSNSIQLAIKQLIFALNSYLSDEQQEFAEHEHRLADDNYSEIIVFNEN